jgi:hypothetical protein
MMCKNKRKYTFMTLVFTSLLITKDRKLAHMNLSPRINNGVNTSDL